MKLDWTKVVFVVMFLLSVVTFLVVLVTFFKVNALRLPTTILVPNIPAKVENQAVKASPSPLADASPSAKVKVKATVAPTPQL